MNVRKPSLVLMWIACAANLAVTTAGYMARKDLQKESAVLQKDSQEIRQKTAELKAAIVRLKGLEAAMKDAPHGCGDSVQTAVYVRPWKQLQ